LKAGGSVEEYNEQAFNNYNTKALVPCPGCARTFLPDRLEVHLRSCQKGKVIHEEKEYKLQIKK
jgi:hypothetical protein